MTAEELLAAARRLVDRPDAAMAGVWPRAAALLARQALELAWPGCGRPGRRLRGWIAAACGRSCCA